MRTNGWTIGDDLWMKIKRMENEETTALESNSNFQPQSQAELSWNRLCYMVPVNCAGAPAIASHKPYTCYIYNTRVE